MKMLKKYFKAVCERRTKELEEMYNKNREIRYTWQDIIEDNLKINKK